MVMDGDCTILFLWHDSAKQNRDEGGLETDFILVVKSMAADHKPLCKQEIHLGTPGPVAEQVSVDLSCMHEYKISLRLDFSWRLS